MTTEKVPSTDPARPLMAWPNLTSIGIRIFEMAETEAAEQLDMDYDPTDIGQRPTKTYHQAAPGLSMLIADQMNRFDDPYDLVTLLSNAEDKLRDDVKELIHPEHFQALVEAAKQHLLDNQNRGEA